MIHRVFALVAMAAFIAEELAHQRRRRKGVLPSSPTETIPTGLRMDTFDVLRLLELVFLALILSTPAGNPACPVGQTSMILVGLQVARLFGRRILSRWSVLGVLQALEILLLLLVILIPASCGGSSGEPLSTESVITLAGTIAYGILLTISSAFSLSYAIKYFSSDTSSVFNSFPPLADAENWALKFSWRASIAGMVGAAGLYLLTGPSVLFFSFTAGVVMQTTACFIARKPGFSGHHPVSHMLWGGSFIAMTVLLALGITDLSRG